MPVTSCTDVWIETMNSRLKSDYPCWSHPVRMCGLKLQRLSATEQLRRSHPVRMCGLKLKEQVSKIITTDVTSCTDVWIETISGVSLAGGRCRSHPVRMCGLKPYIISGNFNWYIVTSCTDVGSIRSFLA